MADLAHYNRLQQIFDGLLQDLSTVWLKQDLDYVREELEHGEYGDALENLVALGLHNGMGFDPDQAQQIEALAAAMGVEDSPFLVQLRKAGRQDAHALGNHTAASFRFGWLNILKQLVLTFVALTLIMAVSAVSGAAVDDFPPMRPIGTAFSASMASQIVSISMFSLLSAVFIWWRARREIDGLLI